LFFQKPSPKTPRKNGKGFPFFGKFLPLWHGTNGAEEDKNCGCSRGVGSRVEDLVANPNPFRRGENPDGVRIAFGWSCCYNASDFSGRPEGAEQVKPRGPRWAFGG